MKARVKSFVMSTRVGETSTKEAEYPWQQTMFQFGKYRIEADEDLTQECSDYSRVAG